jgi:lipoprotein-releasing system ATP-binding protein
MLVELRDVTKTYQTGAEAVEVLRGITLEVDQGKVVSVTGESGSGKSTLLNIIGGLDRPNGGSVTVGGHQVNALSEEEITEYRSRSIGFVFQFHYLLRDFSALENVSLPAIIAGESAKSARARASALLEEVNLGERLNHLPAELSGGERQRVAVARALINGPLLVLADEPTGNLDEDNSRLVQDLLFRVVGDHGSTLILVTHDPAFSRRGELHFRLDHGRLVDTNGPEGPAP